MAIEIKVPDIGADEVEITEIPGQSWRQSRS